jgi:AcrR family transcriptional regulator
MGKRQADFYWCVGQKLEGGGAAGQEAAGLRGRRRHRKSADMGETKPKRTRLSPEARRSDIVATAERLVLAQGHLPAPLDRLAVQAGVSKALIYAYFPTQHDLFNAVLRSQFERLLAAGLEADAAREDLAAAALACALAYFDHIAREGPIIHVILRDPYMAGRLDPAVAAMRDRIVRRLARTARRSLKLSAKEAVAALGIMTTLPEEAGRLVHAGEMEAARGREMTAMLVEAGVEALAPRAD